MDVIFGMVLSAVLLYAGFRAGAATVKPDAPVRVPPSESVYLDDGDYYDGDYYDGDYYDGGV